MASVFSNPFGRIKEFFSLLLSLILIFFTGTQVPEEDFDPNTVLTVSEAVSIEYDEFGNFDKNIETPCIISPTFSTDDVIIADIIATNEEFGADPSGVRDSTKAIKQSIEACKNLGGGTFWLPKGRYIVTEPINIPAYVTLRGDWQDPEQGNEYGTVILAMQPSSNKATPGLFNIQGSAGVIGLTIYYPEQNLDDIKPYPFTFYVDGLGDGYMLQSIVNCTILNGYRGIGATIEESQVHEMLTVDTVRMTCLNVGAHAMDQADVGTWKNLIIDNKYWANVGEGFVAPNKNKLDAYTRKNTTGLMLGDLEWTEFSNLKITGCKTGIHIVKGKRIEFAGSLFDVNIKDCDIGILADHMDERWGMLVARGEVEASLNSVVNNTGATIKLADVSLSGDIKGEGIVQDMTPLDNIKIDYNRSPARPAEKLWLFSADNSGQADIGANLQAALNVAGEEGGGVVYLPAGRYRLDRAVSVPAGVELRGSSSVAHREMTNNEGGTLIYAYYGRTLIPDKAMALVTLTGESAGVRGLRFIYPENNFLDGVRKYSFTIRGSASGVYAVNVAITAAYNGIDFRGCDGHYIKKLVGCSYNNMMTVGGEGGMIEGCLQNGNAIYRKGSDFSGWPKDETKIWKDLFDPIIRRKTEYIRIENASCQLVLNTFAYGVKTLVVSKNSSDVSLINIGADNIGNKTPLLDTRGGSLIGVNIMRYNGKSYKNSSTELRLFNRLTINDKTEQTV